MNTYIVTIRVRNGDYEKHITTLRTAHNGFEAQQDALASQCHYEIGDGAEWVDDGAVEDCHGEFIYEAYKCYPVDKKDVATLRKYLTEY